MNLQEYLRARLNFSCYVNLNSFSKLIEDQTINKENFNEFIEILKEYSKLDNTQNYSKLIDSIHTHIDPNFDLNSYIAEDLNEENDETENESDEVDEDYDDENEDRDYDEDEEEKLSSEELHKLLGKLFDSAEEEVAEQIKQFSKSLLSFDSIQDYLMQCYEHLKELSNMIDEFYHEPAKEEWVKLYDESEYYAGDKYSWIYHEELEHEKIFKKSFFEFFVRKLKELEISKKDLIALNKYDPINYFDVVLDADKSKESQFDEQIEKIQEIYDASVEETRRMFESEELDRFKSYVCETLNLDQSFLDAAIKVNCLVNDFSDSNFKFSDLNEDQRLELIEVLKDNEIAQNRLKEIIDNHLDSNYDFESLMNYLKKKEKKNILNI